MQDKQPQWQINWRTYTQMWLVLAAGSTAAMYYYLTAFNKPWLGAIFHLLLIFTFVPWAIVGSIWLSHSLFKRRGIGFHLNAVLLLILSLSLALFYSFNGISNHLWGENLTLALVAAYIRDLNIVLEFIPLTQSSWIAVWVTLSSLLALFYAAMWRIAKSLVVIPKILPNTSAIESHPHLHSTAGEIGFLSVMLPIGSLYLYFFVLFVSPLSEFTAWFLLFLAAQILITLLLFRSTPAANRLVAAMKSPNASRPLATFLRSRPAQARRAIFTLACAGHILGLAYLFGFRVEIEALRSEPLISFLYNMEYIGSAPSPQRLAISQADQKARQAYVAVETTGPRPNIIVIVVDALRVDHISANGYIRKTTPFLDTHIEDGRIQQVDRTLSSCASSYCGILSILTGKSVHHLSENNLKVYDLLHDQGYQVHFIASGSHTNYYNLRAAYGPDIDFYYSGEHTHWSRDDDRLVLDGLKQMPVGADTPYFLYIHLMSAHLAGVKLPEYAIFQPSHLSLDLSLLRSNNEVRVNRYDNGVVQADAYLQGIFEILQDRQILSNALVIITSDHGENLEVGTSLGHADSLSHTLTDVPLMIMTSNPEKKLGTTTATHIDIAPTILDYLNQPIPSVWPGRSLFEPPLERFTFHETTKYPAIRGVVWWQKEHIFKYLITGNTRQLFDIYKDPKEQIELTASIDPEVIATLEAQYQRFWDSP